MYPLILEQLSPEAALWVPDDAAVKTVYDKLKEQDLNLPFPYWAKIWASSKAMVAFLQEEPYWIENKQVLEIAAGIGVPSFSIAKKAANITISDYASEAVILANKNIVHLNVTNVSAIILDWNHIPEHTTADTILLSDANYEPAAHNKLILLVEKFINNGSTIILSTPNRLSSTPFIERISKYIYSSKNYKMIENESLVEIAVVVLKQ